jgi:hypothetical protein
MNCANLFNQRSLFGPHSGLWLSQPCSPGQLRRHSPLFHPGYFRGFDQDTLAEKPSMLLTGSPALERARIIPGVSGIDMQG